MQSDNIKDNFDIKIPKEVYTQLNLYKNEIIYEISDYITVSDNILFLEAISIQKSEGVFYNTKFHFQIIENYIYFNEYKILEDYLLWQYSVSKSMKLNLDFYKEFYLLVIKISKNYLDAKSYKSIKNIYLSLLNVHEELKNQKSIKINYTNELSNSLYEALLFKSKDEVIKICEPYCLTIDDFCNFFTNHISAVMNRVGKSWQNGEITVAQEHKVTALLEKVIDYFFQLYDFEEKKDKVIVLATIPNERHSLVIKILGNLLSKKGYKVISLGFAKDETKILKAVSSFEPDLFILSITISINLISASKLITKVKEKSIKKELNIIAGGKALDILQEPLKCIKADYYTKNLQALLNFI